MKWTVHFDKVAATLSEVKIDEKSMYIVDDSMKYILNHCRTMNLRDEGILRSTREIKCLL